MNTQNLKSYSGWIVAAGLSVFLFASGFQSGGEKTAVVDLGKVASESKLGRQNIAKMQTAETVRIGLIDFLSNNPVATIEQATQLRTLSLKDPQTEADKTQLDKIKKDITDSAKRRSDLMTKTNLTEAEQRMISEFRQRAGALEELLNGWLNEFRGELGNLQMDLNKKTIDKARTSLAIVAKAQGVTVVLDIESAPYGANDLTAATIVQADK